MSLYFDYAATTPMSQNALDVYQECAKNYWQNTESLHHSGRKAQLLLNRCRNQLAEIFHTSSDSLLFTSGGCESNQLAIQLALMNRQTAKTATNLDKKRISIANKILVSPLEHDSIYQTLELFPQFIVQKLPINNNGEVTPESLAEQLTDDVLLVIVQHVNSITGIVQPIEQLAKLTSAKNIWFHCDGVQAFTKYTVPEYITSYSTSGHKIYGPKGSGLLYLQQNQLTLSPLFPRTNAQFGYRMGTIDLPSIAAFTEASLQAFSQQKAQLLHLKKMNHYFLDQLNKKTKHQPLCYPQQFLGIQGILLHEILGQTALMKLDEQQIATSVTSACHAQLKEPDPSLTALSLSSEASQHFLRISFEKNTNFTDIDQLIHALSTL